MAELPEDPASLENWEIAPHLENCATVRILEKALNTTAYTRAMKGQTVDGTKLIRKKSDRIWKDGAIAKLEAEYGETAYQPRKIMTPPNVEKLVGGKAMVASLAHKPDTGLTLVLDSKPGVAIKPQTAAEVFAGVKT